MKHIKKICAIVLALVMVLAMGTTAFAAGTDLEENGEAGVADDWDAADTERTVAASVNIKKQIIAYNPNGDDTSTTVYAPVFTYTYTVTPATNSDGTAAANPGDDLDMNITDETGDHANNTAVTVPVKAGITTGLVVTGADAAGTAVAGSAGTATSASATLVFDNTSTWVTAAAGHTNEYDINLNFSGVTFSKPGVYRYKIAETINQTSYAVVAMQDGGTNELWLDVYVNGSGTIYGYVCMSASATVTPATTTKLNGFVSGTADGSDKYYTYDLVLSKDVVGDNYAASNTAFPYTVFFNNNESYTSTFKISQTVGTGSTGLDSSASTLTLTSSAVALSGVASVKDGNTNTGTTVGDITLAGIPAGMDVDVYETNIATGVTYSASTVVTGGTAAVDSPVIWGTVPASAVAQTDKAAFESTKATVDTTAITTTAAQSVAITNTLLEISPTGYVVRIAPYALMLGAGVALLLITRRRREDAQAA